MTPSTVEWLAFGINNVDPGRSIISDPWLQSYGFDAVNSSNVAGDLIYNDTATNSDVLIQSVSNYVVTALIPTHIYDLALIKEFGSGYNGNVTAGDTV